MGDTRKTPYTSAVGDTQKTPYTSAMDDTHKTPYISATDDTNETPYTDPTRLIIKELPDCNQHYLKRLFEKEGEGNVLEVMMDTPEKHSAILRYADAEALKRVLLRLPITMKGRKLDVGIFYPMAGDAQTGSTIQVHGVDRSMPEELLKLYFQNRKRSGGGEVTNVKVDYKKGDALVKFAKEDDAWRVAYQAIHSINKKCIQCQFIPESKAGTSFTVQIVTRPDVKHRDDITNCDVRDCCQMEDGSFVMIDFNNKSVKLIDHIGYKVLDRLKLPQFPTAVCTTGAETVAVGTFRGGVYILTVEKNVISSKVKTFGSERDCLGVGCYGKQLYVSDRQTNDIHVYNLKGEYLRQFAAPSSDPYYRVAACEDKLFITHKTKGLISMSKDGKHLNRQTDRTMTDRTVQCAHGVCVGGGGRVFVTGWNSHNVCQVTSTGTERQQFVVIGSNAAGLKHPSSVCFDRVNSALIVTCRDQDFVTIFHLSN